MSIKNQIPALFNEYNIGPIDFINDQSHGYANKNFCVATPTGKYFVRICLQQSIDNIMQELHLMSALKQYKFKTAYPIYRPDGEIISYINNTPVVIYEHLEGSLPQVSDMVVSEIAIHVAALSKIKIPDQITKENAISINDSLEIISSDAYSKYKNKDVTDSFTGLIEALSPSISIDIPVGIVHGDIFPDNTLFLEKELVGIVDFEEFAIDSLMFDVGMTINGFCFSKLELNPTFLGIFLSGYNAIRKLSTVEKDLVVDYMAWGSVGMTSWHLHQLLYRKNKKQLERVRELLERAEWILSNRTLLEKLINESL